ncbi:MAG TPA: amino acid adenylation domain-containing protein [Coleofasciculaceae cyanobacterium]
MTDFYTSPNGLANYSLNKLDLLQSSFCLEQQNVDTYPLSPMQSGMLFNSLYTQQPGVDVEQIVLTLREPINTALFQQAWQQVIQRHAILRTSFRWEGLDQPEQQVQQQVNLFILQQDWQGLPSAVQQQRLEAYLKSDRQQSFDLEQAPLMRLALCQTATDSYQFIWTFHHILLDGRSFPILLKEVFALYEVSCQGQNLQLGAPPPYKNYINWLQQQDMTQSEDYWRQLLAGFTRPTPLPNDVANASAESGQDEVAICLSRATTAALKAMAQQQGITPNTVVQGAWAILLGHFSGTYDVVFGATRACRHGVEAAESMVGLLINTLPVRVKIAPQASLISWLHELRTQHVAIRPHEHTPLTQVQQWSEVPAGVPLFDSMVMFENSSLTEALQALGAEWQTRDIKLWEQPSFPLVLIGNLGTELSLRVSYRCSQFSAANITRMLERLKVLLEDMIANPEQRIADLSIWSTAQQNPLLVEWNATEVDYPKHLRLHDLFEAQVTQTPDAIALIFNDKQLTYRELNQQANQLAHYLQKVGIQPEIPVGICIERSLDMIIGLLAIVKAGGAYVPLDPTYPQDRLAHILSDSQLAVVLTQEKFLPIVPSQDVPIVCLDQDWDTIAAESMENPTSPVTAENLAYIIYTSGSTGKPKGVLIEHRGAVNTVLDVNRRFQVSEGDRVLAVCSLNFDLSVYDVFGLLGTGGTVVIPQPTIAPDLDHWIDLMVKCQITVWNSAPPVMQMLAGHLADCDRLLPASLKLVMLSGDWIPVTLPDLIRRLKPGDAPVAIISLGGATEVSIWSIFYAIEAIDPSWKSIPYGKPLGNQQFYVLDEQRNPVPLGEVGELYIGGDGVARGYLNRPDLNEAKFIADPFRAHPDARLYRTGDLGRYMPDGNIEFLGRIDHQVKIRGFRVELGEIEVVLSQHPAIRETAILAQDDATGNKRLVAYLVAERNYTGQLVNEVRSFLQEKLPAYMVPSAFVTLTALPLTPNGKLDRKALPVADLSAQAMNAASSVVAPRDEIERQLVNIWQSCLGVQPIGITDNFFELGGHSLLGVRLWSRIGKTFPQNLPLATLFQAPTIEQLANHLRRAINAPVDEPAHLPACPSLVIIQQGERDRTPLFCLHVLGRGLSFYRPMARYVDAKQPIYGLSTQITGEIFLSNQVKDLAAHYVQQMRIIQPHGPYLLAGVSFGGLVAYEVAQQLVAQGQEISLLALLDTRLPSALKPLPKPKQLKRHWSQLTDAGFSHMFSKIQARAMGQWQQISDVWQTTSYDVGIKLSEITGRPLSDEWQDHLYRQQNRQSAESYTLEPYSGSITLFRATDQRLGGGLMLEPDLGWQDLAMGGLEIHHIPGDHLGMLEGSSAQILGETLNICLAEALGETVQRSPLHNSPTPSDYQPDFSELNGLQTERGFA